jgi:2-keto-4-pentenoate hydratase/2-oxohepta-3-ene-1,7-dioic acid hydratase in catechol pathway
MPLAVFSNGGPKGLGKIFGERIVDLSVAAPELPDTVKAVLAAGAPALERFKSVGADAPGGMALGEVRLHAPVPDPEKFMAIGLNYKDHAEEAAEFGLTVPEYQLWFNKQVSCINGPFDPVVLPKVSDQLDYEVELAVVIGRTCRHVAVDEARSVIGGYMVANDVSVRDWQRRSTTHTLGKSFDTHGPIGPWLTLDHEIADPEALPIRMLINGVVKQRASTANMINRIFDQIAYLSTVMTLKPGDILLTGTPAGVGAARKPPAWVKAGDIMRAEIDGLGHIENPVIEEA